MNESDRQDALQQAYNTAKQRYPAPGRIKRAVLNQQPGNQQRFLDRAIATLPGREWLALAAAVGCLLLLVKGAPLINQPMPDNDIIALEVEYHGYQDDVASLPDYREKLTLYTREFTRQLDTLNVFYSRPAMLASHQGNWLFTDCDNQTITVSHELIDDLRALQRVDPALVEGTFVALAFDKQGRLIKIEQVAIKSC
ncbi:MAG: hypothetical protein VYD53_07935 [Pseudomonadota bacterium]|nr:hypothetical protein [Pseudomonadota bacterium]